MATEPVPLIVYSPSAPELLYSMRVLVPPIIGVDPMTKKDDPGVIFCAVAGAARSAATVRILRKFFIKPPENL